MAAYRADGLPLQVEARKIELIGLKAMLPNTPKGKSRKLIDFPAARKAHKPLFQIARSTALCAGCFGLAVRRRCRAWSCREPDQRDGTLRGVGAVVRLFPGRRSGSLW